jgi:hypothetical protein
MKFSVFNGNSVEEAEDFLLNNSPERDRMLIMDKTVGNDLFDNLVTYRFIVETTPYRYEIHVKNTGISSIGWCREYVKTGGMEYVVWGPSAPKTTGIINFNQNQPNIRTAIRTFCIKT